ncbi:MAG: LLM class F420-dependent oxidoreductase [Acidimicrobiia bacterium]
MKVDQEVPGDLARVAGTARAAETQGYDGLFTSETSFDPFLPLVLAAEHTERVELMTCIAVAFARSPMTLANTAHDLHRFSGGRFVLGLGSQIKAHVERRFSMPWSHPAARMREMILAIRAIWRAWDEGEKLDFRGEFYSHTLMAPYFDPGPNPTAPLVYLAGVGELMTQVAGEVADGYLCHGFTTPKYLREVTLPALERGLATSGRTLDGFDVSGPMFVATGVDEADLAARADAVRSQVAFYASTPAYKGVLDVHGWGDLGDELRALTRQGRWDDMDGLVDDEVLHTFAAIAMPDELPSLLAERYGGLLTRVSFTPPAALDPDQRTELLAAIRAI